MVGEGQGLRIGFEPELRGRPFVPTTSVRLVPSASAGQAAASLGWDAAGAPARPGRDPRGVRQARLKTICFFIVATQRLPWVYGPLKTGV